MINKLKLTAKAVFGYLLEIGMALNGRITLFNEQNEGVM